MYSLLIAPFLLMLNALDRRWIAVEDLLSRVLLDPTATVRMPVVVMSVNGGYFGFLRGSCSERSSLSQLSMTS